jgi:hypothetical protein
MPYPLLRGPAWPRPHLRMTARPKREPPGLLFVYRGACMSVASRTQRSGRGPPLLCRPVTRRQAA